MGIVNLTPDSFSDGGQFLSPEDAVAHARQMVEQGAQIIDLGGESTRPGSEPVSEQDELARVLPVIESLLKEDFVLSLDTTKPAVALAGLQAGISILNDVSGGNQEMLEHASRFQAGYVVMHTQGSPQTMQDSPKYDDVVEEVRAFFDAKAEDLQALELPRLWIDPGIGFGKTLEHNLALMRELDELIDPRWGILLGSSRKSWIDHLCNAPDPLDRLGRFPLFCPCRGCPGCRNNPCPRCSRNRTGIGSGKGARPDRSNRVEISHSNFKTMGKIVLEDIEVMVRIGLLEEELYAPQDLTVTVEIEHSFAQVSQSDDLADGIDYRDVIEHIRNYCGNYDGKTIERLADQLSKGLKEKFPADSVRLIINKPRYVNKLGLSAIRVEVEC